MNTTNHKTPNPFEAIFGDEPMPDDPTDRWSYVYIMAAEKFVKIGWSCDPRRRLANIRTASPFPVRLVATFRFTNNMAIAAEAFIHKKLKRYARQGEWFRLSPERAENELAKWFSPLAGNPFYSAYLMEAYPPRRRNPIIQKFLDTPTEYPKSTFAKFRNNRRSTIGSTP